MAGVRVLVGTRKGAFVLTADGTRDKWAVRGPFFGGWEVYHLKGSPADPDRIYASQSSSWFGQQIQRSDDGGVTWNPVGNKFAYEGVPGTHHVVRRHAAPVGVQARLAPRTVADRPGPRCTPASKTPPCSSTTDGGGTWAELPGLRTDGSGARWQPGAGGMCLHTILLDPSHPKRIFIAISAAGAFRTDDAGARPGSRSTAACKSKYIPDPTAEVGHCVHRIAMHQARPNVLFMQKHWDVMRSDDAGDTWQEISGNLPTDFGFPIDVHAHEPDTVYVVPIKSDAEHYPPDGKLRVYRSRSGGNEWEPLTKPACRKRRLLRQRPARRDGRRFAGPVRRLLRHHRRPGVRLRRRGRHVGRRRPRPAPRGVRGGANPAMIRVQLPTHLRDAGARGRPRGDAGSRRGGDARRRSDRPRSPLPRCSAARCATTARSSAGRCCASSPARKTYRMTEPDKALPAAVANGEEPFLVVGAIAGG